VSCAGNRDAQEVEEVDGNSTLEAFTARAPECARVAWILAGCAGTPGLYRLTEFPNPDDRSAPLEESIVRGKPNVLLDGLNHYVLSLPTKLLLLDWHALDHRLPAESELLLRSYLHRNQLSVLVRHNQYDPVGEWRRLFGNREVSAFWRYSLGTLSVLQYSLLPGRLLAGVPIIGTGDHFNPFTNTINVYSSDPTILLHEGGHAKDYAETRLKGTLAATRLIPGVDLYQEAMASRDAIRFLYCIDEPSLELRAYRTLFPAYATYLGSYVPGVSIAGVVAVVPGHIGGRLQAYRRKREMQDPEFVPRSARPEYCVPIERSRPPEVPFETPLQEAPGVEEGSAQAGTRPRSWSRSGRGTSSLHL